jgi:hypothetical protein
MFKTLVCGALPALFSPETAVSISRFLIRRPTITWGASATLAPYMVSTRDFCRKLTGALLREFFTKATCEKPEKNCEFGLVILRMWITRGTFRPGFFTGTGKNLELGNPGKRDWSFPEFLSSK